MHCHGRKNTVKYTGLSVLQSHTLWLEAEQTWIPKDAVKGNMREACKSISCLFMGSRESEGMILCTTESGKRGAARE